MKKHTRLLALLLTVLMVFGLVPVESFATQSPADAPQPLAAPTTTVTYEKADKLEAGQKYLIVYTTGEGTKAVHHILSNNGAAFENNVTGTLSGRYMTLNNSTEKNVLWKANLEKGAFYFTYGDQPYWLGFYDHWGQMKLRIGEGGTICFYVKNGNDVTNPTTLWRDGGKSFGKDNPDYYLQYAKGQFTVLEPKDPTQLNHITFYKRVETTTVNTTAKWFVDGKQVGEDEVIAAKPGETVTFAQKPSMPATAKLVKKVVDGQEVALSTSETYTATAGQNVEYYFLSDPVTVTVEYFYEGETVADNTQKVLVPRNQAYTITPPAAFDPNALVRMEVNGKEVADKSLTITPTTDTRVTLTYKVAASILTVEWYVAQTDASGSTGPHYLYKSEKYAVKVDEKVTLQKPAPLNGLAYDKAEINNGGVLDQTGKKEPTQVTIKNSGDTVVKVYYTYARGSADNILYPDDVTSGAEIPEYPHQGAVRIDKTATAQNFWGNGVARVELATTGIPVKQGVDVVLVIDTSNSMKGPNKTEARIKNAKAAAEEFVTAMFAPNPDGTASSNRVGLVTFSANQGKFPNKIWHPLRNANNSEEVLKTIRKLDYNGRTAEGNEINKNTVGTDYDSAMENAQKVLNDALPSREKVVIFLTDGAPTIYNDYKPHKDKDRPQLPDSNKGDITRPPKEGSGTWHILNEEHKATDNLKNGPSKATVYTVGLQMQFENANFTGPEKVGILKRMASTPDLYVDANEPDQLTKVFGDIANAIRKAGTNAVVTDRMGADYDLQMKNTVPDGKGGVQTLNPAPSITVTSYDLDKDGKRTGTSTVLETVTFNADGTKAYSDQIGGKTNILDKNGNIKAKNFTYYTKATRLPDGTSVEAETFVWNIGDITTAEIALSYDVYLTGSMEGNRPDGVYPTNKSARLDYINYKGNKTHQDFVKPNMSWGDAVVNYQFYLVDKYGDAVNTRGDKIPFEHRVPVGPMRSKTFELNSSEDIIALQAADVMPKGYELHMPDARFEVHAVSDGAAEGNMTAIGHANTAAGYTGNSTRFKANDKQCINTTVYFGIVNTVSSVPDVVVLDYGKPVTIDVLANDRILGGKLYGVYGKDFTLYNTENLGIQPGRESTSVPPASKDASWTGRYGKAEVNSSGKEGRGTVIYSLQRFFDGVENFRYVTRTDVKEGEVTTSEYRYQDVTVIPATTVYYEDNFASSGSDAADGTNGIIFSGNWTTENNGGAGASQQDDGSIYDHPYGQDSGYTDNNGLSAGSAHMVKGDKNNPPTATFTFKGTGFDLIGRTDMNSGAIIVKVQQDGKILSNKIIDCQFRDSNINGGTLYQIPVHEWRADGDTYGTYTVTISVRPGKNNPNGTFYLDGIRVYNPAQGNQTAEDKYLEDGEANAYIRELRQMLLADTAFGPNRSVYVDSHEGVTEMSVYEQIGPNNEVYLKPGQSIGVKIATAAQPVSVQLGAKTPTGKATFTAGSTGSESSYTLNTATGMYYDITQEVNFDKEGGATLVITNTGSGNEILSLTHLKLTFADAAAGVSLFSDEALAQETIQLTQARMAPLPEDTETAPEPQPEPQPEPDKPEKPHTSIEKIFQEMRNFFENLFGGIFGK